MLLFSSFIMLVSSFAQSSAEVSKQISIIREVAYTTPVLNSYHKPLTMDVAFPNTGSELLPVIIYIHGGGWNGGSKSEGEKFISLMAHGGYFAVSIDFRGTDEGGFPETIIDITSAINFIIKYKDQLNINPEFIGLVGYSSGGHLAVLSACSINDPTMQSIIGLTNKVNTKIKCVASINGAVVLKYLPRKFKEDVLKWSGSSNGQMGFIFPSTYIDKDDPPIFLLSGKEDRIVPNRLARQFSNLLTRNNVENTFQTLQKTGHVISEPAEYFDLLKFVDHHLQGKAYQVLSSQIQ